jgi:hypothetical protein
MRLIRLFWLPERPVPPEGTPERAEYEALQNAAFGVPENRWIGRWCTRILIFFLCAGIVIDFDHFLDPPGLEYRLGAAAIFIAIAWRWLRRRR